MNARCLAGLWAACLVAAQEPSGEAAQALEVAAAAPDCQRLAALQERGELDLHGVLAALAGDDEDAGAMAAAIVRHTWPELPPGLLRGLDRSPRAAHRLLRELALAPRPAARAWVELQAAPAPGRTLDERCLALAARGQPLAATDAALLLQALAAGEPGEGWRLAAGMLPPAVADGALGRLHALLLQGTVDVAAAMPWFERLSAAGTRQLLAVAVTLPPADAELVCDHVARRDAAAVLERVRAALDGEVPLDELWLRHAAPLLDRPARSERLLAVLDDPAAPRPLQQRAFAALLDARLVEARLIRWAEAGDDDRLANLTRLLAVAVDRLPADRLLDWLGADPALALRVVRALARRPVLGPALERALLRPFAGGAAEGAFLEPAMAALLQRGSEVAVRKLWPHLRGSSAWSEAVDMLSRRRTPFAIDLLQAELAAPPPAGMPAEAQARRLDEVRLGLVALGVREPTAELVARAPGATPNFVRRCAHHARPLAPDLALRLLDAAAVQDDADLAAELATWAASCADPAVLARLQALWESPATGDTGLVLREVALRALVAGPARPRMTAALRAALAEGPLPEALAPLPFELIAAMGATLAPADLHLLAELALLPALAEPERERDLVRRGPDARGFPLAAAVGQRLLGADPAAAGQAFAAVAAAVAVDPRRNRLSRQRLVALWRSLARDREVLQAVGAATAALCLELPAGGDGFGAGPAHAFLQQAAAGRGDWIAAARHARAAIGGLLLRPQDQATARQFLGERDPAGGV
ncbi:MAG: hypothetical protein KF830_18385, partial [Planctomycetes bacterium]|nr:hypothetical protein [Planctomycetota bacterium]